MMTPPVKSGPRYNQMITSDKVRVIDENGENLGVMYTREAIEQAAEVGLDLVEISPNADPPVAKFLDVGKFRYEAQKKANAARKSQKTQEIKEIKMRPNIDDHDYDTKMKAIHKFIGEGGFDAGARRAFRSADQFDEKIDVFAGGKLDRIGEKGRPGEIDVAAAVLVSGGNPGHDDATAGPRRQRRRLTGQQADHGSADCAQPGDADSQNLRHSRPFGNGVIAPGWTRLDLTSQGLVPDFDQPIKKAGKLRRRLLFRRGAAVFHGCHYN